MKYIDDEEAGRNWENDPNLSLPFRKEMIEKQKPKNFCEECYSEDIEWNSKSKKMICHHCGFENENPEFLIV